jgi:uncharacterized repeat protein (TIGR01451 family)
MKGLPFLRNLFLILIILFQISCSGGDGDVVGTGVGPEVSGTAAVGSPIAHSRVYLKDTHGDKRDVESDDNGRFSFDVKGMTPPFLLSVRTEDGRRLFSIAANPNMSNGAKNTANIHPFTDVIARNWFGHRGRDIEAEFDDDGEIASPPLASQISALIIAVKNLLAVAFADPEFGVDENFDLIHTPFSANSTGFDKLLDFTTITIQENKITIRLEDPVTGFTATIVLKFDLSVDLSQQDSDSPSEPTSLVLIPASSTSIAALWNSSIDNIGVSGYNVYRTDDPQSNNLTLIADSPYPHYIDNGLLADTEYCYTVEAFDGAGNQSTKPEKVCARTLSQDEANPPTPPQDLIATAVSSNTIALTWTPSPESDVLGYDVFQQTNGQPSTKIATTVASNFTDTGLMPDTEYCYQLQVFDGDLNRANLTPTQPVCATTAAVSGDTQAPVTIVSPAGGVYASSQEVTLSCSDNSGECSIHYTIDGTDPTTNSPVYTQAITVSTDTTLKYFAIDGAGNIEDWKFQVYTIDASSTPPIVSGVSPTTGLTPTWTWTSGGGNGTFRYKLNDNNLSIGATQTTSTSYTPSSALSPGYYTLYVQEQTDTGTWSETGSHTILIYSALGTDSLSVDVSVLSSPVVAGGYALYTITVGNSTNSAISGVTVSTTIPVGLSFNDTVDVVPDPGGCAAIGTSTVCDPTETAQWGLGTLTAGESGTITFNALVNASLLDGDTVDLPVAVSAIGQGDILVTKTVTVNKYLASDLALSASVDPIMPGETFELSVDVGNTSGGALNNVKLQTTLPAGVTVNSASNGGTDQGNGQVEWDVGSLARGESLHRTVSVTADGNLVGGQILHAYLVLSHDGGLAVDNTAEQMITVQNTVFPLSVDIATSANPVVAGDRVLYTVTVSNRSATTSMSGVTVQMRTPVGLSYLDTVDVVPDPGGCATLGTAATCEPREEAVWGLGTLSPGESQTITVNALVDADQQNGDLIATPVHVTAVAGSDTVDLLKVVHVNNIPINSNPTTALELSASTDPVIPGETFILNVDVGNTSDADLNNVELRATLPADLTVNSVSNGGSNPGNGEVVWTIPALTVGESLHREINVTADGSLAGGQILHADLALTHDGNPEADHTTEHVVSVQGTALPLNVDVATSANPVVAGERVLYTVTVSNRSATTSMSGVTVQMRTPVGLSYLDTVDVVPDPGGCATLSTAATCEPREEAVWGLGTLSPGESQTITVNALVDADQQNGDLIATPVHVTAVAGADTVDLLKVVHVNNIPINSNPTTDLALSASPDPDPLNPGSTADPVQVDVPFVFNIDVGNTSGATLDNIVMRATLPTGVTINSISDSVSATVSGNVVEWTVTNLAADASLHRDMLVTVSGLSAGEIVDLDVVLMHDGGVEIDNSAQLAVSVVDTAPPLTVSLAATPNTDGTVDYTIDVTNVSDQSVSGVVVQYRVPDELSFNNTTAVDPDPGGCATLSTATTCEPREEVVWGLGTLVIGESRQITVHATIVGGPVSGTLIYVPVRVTATQLMDVINLYNTVVVQP